MEWKDLLHLYCLYIFSFNTRILKNISCRFYDRKTVIDKKISRSIYRINPRRCFPYMTFTFCSHWPLGKIHMHVFWCARNCAHTLGRFTVYLKNQTWTFQAFKVHSVFMVKYYNTHFYAQTSCIFHVKEMNSLRYSVTTHILLIGKKYSLTHFNYDVNPM